MLILTRKTDQEIRIGDDIVLKVLEINGDQVKLGIDAPRQVEVHREEIYRAIQDENSTAAKTPAALVSKLNEKLQNQRKGD